MRRVTLLAIGLTVTIGTAGATQDVLASGNGCIPTTTCTPPPPACGETTSCSDDCGNVIYSDGAPAGPCVPSETLACGASGPGTDNCGACTAYGDPCPPGADGDGSGGSGSSGPVWLPYGYAVPGDPVYGYGLPDNNTRDFLALAAKGNVILGDYTSPQFAANVLPKLGNGQGSVTQPYTIDATDEPLGYHDAGFDAKGLPRFSGNYDQIDQLGQGVKTDGTSRKFYESSLSDAEFRSLIDPSWNPAAPSSEGRVDAVLFTNHLLAGYAPQTDYLYQFGSLVARDDALMFRSSLWIDHDARLSQDQGVAMEAALPFGIKRARLVHWEELPP